MAHPTSRGKRLVYLDSAATSQKPRAVIQALVDYYERYNANIHRGVYEIAARATDEYERLASRSPVSSVPSPAKSSGFAIRPRRSIWSLTVGEAPNLKRGDAILLTELEHHSDLVPWQALADRNGAELRFIPIDDRGRYVLDDLDRLLDGCKLVAAAHVSNTLGTIAPLDIIVPRAHAAGAVVLIDGAQGAPHLPVDVKALDVDFYAFSGHKMLGPTGIGALYGKRALLEAMPPFLYGGDMIKKVEYAHTTFSEPPRKFEAGTSNIADAIAFGVAVEYLESIGMEWVREHERTLVGYALDRLAVFEPRGLEIYGPRDPERDLGRHLFQLRRRPLARPRLDSRYRRNLHPRRTPLHHAAHGKDGLVCDGSRLVLYL